MSPSISKDSLALLDRVLPQDGFLRRASGIYVKSLADHWCGYIGVTSTGFSLSPMVGVFSTIVRDVVYYAAKGVYNRPHEKVRKLNYGPPNFMVPLQTLAEDDPAFQNRISWRDLTGKTVEAVVDDLLICMRSKALPLMDANTNFPTLLESALRFGTLNHAQQFSTPVIMMLLGKTDQLDGFVKLCMAQYDPVLTDLGPRYMSYLKAAEVYLRDKGLLLS